MNPRIVNGWIVVDCDAPDSVRVSIGTDADKEMRPAFRDYDNGVRVAKVRVPAIRGRVRVLVRVNDQVREAGLISL